MGDADDAGGRAPHDEAGTRPPPARLRPRSGGVSVVAGGLLQDLEDRMRRDLAPVEERVRPGEEIRGLGGNTGGAPWDATDPLVIVLRRGT